MKTLIATVMRTKGGGTRKKEEGKRAARWKRTTDGKETRKDSDKEGMKERRKSLNGAKLLQLHERGCIRMGGRSVTRYARRLDRFSSWAAAATAFASAE